MQENIKKMKRKFVAFGLGFIGFWVFFEYIIFGLMNKGPRDYVIYDEKSNTMYVAD